MQDQFASFGTLAFAIDRYSPFGAEVADPQLGPGMTLRRAYTEPVQNRSDATIRQKTSKLLDELFSRRAGFPAMLAVAALLQFQRGMIAALPMKLQSEMARLGSHDHLFKHRA